MKRSAEIISLPVLSITSGKTVGEVRGLVLNPQTGRVDFLLVSPEVWYGEMRVLPVGAVLGIGPDAVTTEKEEDVAPAGAVAEAVLLLEKKVQLVGSRILTRRGRLIGRIREVLIDEDSGEVAGCEVVGVNGEDLLGILQRSAIVTFGSEFVIVSDDFESYLLTSEVDSSFPKPEAVPPEERQAVTAAPVGAAEGEMPAEKEAGSAEEMAEEEEEPMALADGAKGFIPDEAELLAEVTSASNVFPDAEGAPVPTGEDRGGTAGGGKAAGEVAGEEKKLSGGVPGEAVIPAGEEAVGKPVKTGPETAGASVPPAGAAAAASLSPASMVDRFQERQRQYLRGKKVGRRIILPDGTVLAEEGTVITDELIDRAQAANKFIELTMYAR